LTLTGEATISRLVVATRLSSPLAFCCIDPDNIDPDDIDPDDIDPE
jgi:hypothetical protein